MSESGRNTSSGVGFLGLLALLFIGLKLGGVIDWPWLWVLAPLWAPLCAVLAICACLFLIAGCVFAVEEIVKKVRRRNA